MFALLHPISDLAPKIEPIGSGSVFAIKLFISLMDEVRHEG
jgi:hypothetical protein